MASVLATRGIERASQAALAALVQTASDLRFDPDYLAAVISFESAGTWDPAVRNRAGSGATGLIQFMPDTARRLGTTTDALAAMTDADQMAYVKKYLEQAGVRQGRVRTLSDLYMAVFAPSAIGKAEDAVLYSSPSSAYTQNAPLDREGKGYITKGDAAGAVQGVYNAAGGRRIEITAPPPDAWPEADDGTADTSPVSRVVPFLLGAAIGVVLVRALWSSEDRRFATAFARATSW